jgi:AcrR family transcriptional regulator
MTTGRPGRPRSEQARRAVLEAARDLLKSKGYEGMSMEGIAARAGVGKQTVYRWWPSKAAVVADAALDGIIPQPPFVLPDTGDLHADLTSWLDDGVRSMTAPEASALIRALAAAASADETASNRLYNQFTGPNRQAVINRLDAARDVGQVRSDADTGSAADALISVNLYLVLARDPITEDRAHSLLDVVMSGIGPAYPQ